MSIANTATGSTGALEFAASLYGEIIGQIPFAVGVAHDCIVLNDDIQIFKGFVCVMVNAVAADRGCFFHNDGSVFGICACISQGTAVTAELGNSVPFSTAVVVTIDIQNSFCHNSILSCGFLNHSLKNNVFAKIFRVEILLRKRRNFEIAERIFAPLSVTTVYVKG